VNADADPTAATNNRTDFIVLVLNLYMNESKRIRQEQQLNNSYSLLDEEERIGNDVCGVD